MRVNYSVYGSVLIADGNILENHVLCELFVGPVKAIVQIPRNKFIESPYCGMPISLTVRHGRYVTLQVRKADVVPFENTRADIETALQIIGEEHV